MTTTLLTPEAILQSEGGVAVRSSDLLARIVALSGGKDSTAMALRLAELEPEADYEYCITPTGRELPVMQDHWKKLECLIGKPLVKIPAPTLVELIVKYKALPNWRMRYCTRQIKIEPFQAYALTKAPSVCYVGIRADEADARAGTDCCFFQTLAEWWRLWRDHKDRWQEIEALETWTEHTLRSDQRDTWPASLKELRAKFEAGYTPKGAAQTNLRLDVAERPTMCAWCAR